MPSTEMIGHHAWPDPTPPDSDPGYYDAPDDGPSGADDQVIELPLAERCTDLGNAKRFRTMFGDEVRWVPEWQRWLRWTGTHWAKVPAEEIRQLAYQVIDRMHQDVERVKSKTKRATLEAHAKRSEGTKYINAMISEAKGLLLATVDQFDRDGYLYNVANGTLNLRAKRIEDVFRSHSREDYITKMVAVEWDAAAQCPRFDKFLGEIFPHDGETAAYVLRTMATCLIGDLVEQSYFLWFGRRGRNGKGVLQRVLNALTEPYRVTIDPRLFFSSFKYDPNAPSSAIMSLRDARLVIGSEMEKEDLIGGAFLKRYTGGDSIAGRDLNEKRRDTREFAPTGTLIISTNHFPRAEPSDDALWARTRIVEFPQHFGGEDGPAMDATLEADLHTELPGVLVRLVGAWMEVQGTDRKTVSLKRGLLNAPDTVIATTQMVRSTFGPLGLFVHEMCVVGKSERVAPRDLYEAYLRWAHEQGKESDEVLTENKFGREMQTMKFEKRKSDGSTYRSGLRLKTEAERNPPAQTTFGM